MSASSILAEDEEVWWASALREAEALGPQLDVFGRLEVVSKHAVAHLARRNLAGDEAV
jgi:hypothetical protein